MNKNIPTVTIGIPAHNEEKNIASLIESIFSQKTDNYILQEVLIHSDNCTDKTVEIVNSLAKGNNKIKHIVSKTRVGKSVGVNRLRHISDADIYISFDADITLGNDMVISEIVKKFSDPKVMLVGTNDIPLAGKTLMGKIVVWRIMYWLSICRNINNGDTVHNHPGRANATRKEFYKTFNLPDIFLADDDFQYFTNKKRKYKFSFANAAIVNYKAPNSLNDFVKQFSRFQDTESVIKDKFGRLATDSYEIPIKNKIIGLLVTFTRDPIMTIVVLITQIYLQIVRKVNAKDDGGLWWDTVKSTK